jgi:hypothetical protein
MHRLPGHVPLNKQRCQVACPPVFSSWCPSIDVCGVGGRECVRGKGELSVCMALAITVTVLAVGVRSCCVQLMYG